MYFILLRCCLCCCQASVFQPAGYASLQSNLMSLQFLHPVHILQSAADADAGAMAGLLPTHQPLQMDMPCDVHLLNLRALIEPEDGTTVRPSGEIGLVLHRLGVDCRFPARGIACRFTDGKVPVYMHKNSLYWINGLKLWKFKISGWGL